MYYIHHISAFIFRSQWCIVCVVVFELFETFTFSLYLYKRPKIALYQLFTVTCVTFEYEQSQDIAKFYKFTAVPAIPGDEQFPRTTTIALQFSSRI